MAGSIQKVFLAVLVILAEIAISSGNLSHGYFASGLSNNLDGVSCDRGCTGTKMDCYFNFKIESYSTMSKACYLCPSNLTDCGREDCVPGNGLKRLLLTVNRQMPGPPIRVCEGDTIIVNVTNSMYNYESTTMHWHGIHQAITNYMDGVPSVTQCPINSAETWTYRFLAYPKGTHWYHSHTGPQRADGLHGALIVKENDNAVSTLYDYDLAEHYVMLSDFEKTPAVVKVVLHEQAKENNKPVYLLINGKGKEERVAQPRWYGGDDWVEHYTPYHVIKVQQGMRYRLRIISNALLNCPVEVFIQDHSFMVIASDGAPIDPVEARVVTLGSGERWDIVVHANQTAANYWLYARGVADCARNNVYIQQLAIINYEGVAEIDNPSGVMDPSTVREANPTWVSVNPFNEGIINPTVNSINLAELSSLESNSPDWLTQQPDHQFYLAMDFQYVDNEFTNREDLYSQESQRDLGGRSPIAQINKISGILPQAPYLTQYEDVLAYAYENPICTYSSSNHNYAEERCIEPTGCHCIHRMVVKTGDIVEMALIDEGKPFNASNHPMHLHGQYWAVVAQGQDASRAISRADVIAADQAGEIPRNFNRSVLKDTIMLPDGGYVITKFKADNPGVWAMHCHNEVHSTQGMMIILEVGDKSEWSNPGNLPVCGNYHYSDPAFRGLGDEANPSGSSQITLAIYSTIISVLIVIS